MEAIQRATEKLQATASKLGEEIYRAAGAAGGAPGAGAAGGKPAAEPGTVDAEYEVVDDDKDRK